MLTSSIFSQPSLVPTCIMGAKLSQGTVKALCLRAALLDRSRLVLSDHDGSLVAPRQQPRLVPGQHWGHWKGTAPQRSG